MLKDWITDKLHGLHLLEIRLTHFRRDSYFSLAAPASYVPPECVFQVHRLFQLCT